METFRSLIRALPWLFIGAFFVTTCATCAPGLVERTAEKAAPVEEVEPKKNSCELPQEGHWQTAYLALSDQLKRDNCPLFNKGELYFSNSTPTGMVCPPGCACKSDFVSPGLEPGKCQREYKYECSLDAARKVSVRCLVVESGETQATGICRVQTFLNGQPYSDCGYFVKLTKQGEETAPSLPQSTEYRET